MSWTVTIGGISSPATTNSSTARCFFRFVPIIYTKYDNFTCFFVIKTIQYLPFVQNPIYDNLPLQALNGFLMILDCQGELFFATHSIETYLGFHQVSRVIQKILEVFSSHRLHPIKPWPNPSRAVSCGTIIALTSSSHSCHEFLFEISLSPGHGGVAKFLELGRISIHWVRPRVEQFIFTAGIVRQCIAYSIYSI